MARDALRQSLLACCHRGWILILISGSSLWSERAIEFTRLHANLLDAHGGSDIVQVAPRSLTFIEGQNNIVGIRLTPKGLYRFYASCCKTPLGNTVGPTIPFVGIVAQALEENAEKRDRAFGRPIGAIYGKYAIGVAPQRVTPGSALGCVKSAWCWAGASVAKPGPILSSTGRTDSRCFQ